MDSEATVIWSLRALAALFLVAIGLGIYQVRVFEDRLAQLNWTLAQEADRLEQAQEAATAALTGQIASEVGRLEDDMTGRIATVQASFSKSQEETIKRFSTLSGQLSQLETTQTAKLETLEERLSHISISSADFSAIIDDIVKGVVSLRTNLGSGSGAILDPRGYVVTNNHVISGIRALSIYGYNGTVYAGALVATNQDRDLALLRIVSEQEFDALELGDSDGVRVGQKVIAVGNPGGLEFSVTEGIVSATNRRDDQGTPLLQIDVPINPGNSGGPLVTAAGEVVGIIDMKVAGYEGLGFAITSNTVESFFEAGLPSE